MPVTLTACLLAFASHQESRINRRGFAADEDNTLIKSIIKDEPTLRKKSVAFNENIHKQVEIDLLDTAKAHEANCAGLAAIQIAEPIRLFVIKYNNSFRVYRNPTILQKSAEMYYATERCLSVEGSHTVSRHAWVKVSYESSNHKRFFKTLYGFEAEVFQHEFDHLEGILI